MSSSQIFIVRDDNFGHGLISTGQWAFTLGDYNFGGDTIYSILNGSNLGAVNVSFQGTSIAFFGNSPPTWASQQFQVTIDNNKPYNTTTSDANPQHYMQWYQSPLLPSGTHSISVSDIDGIALDYMVITPGPDTPLTGQTLMVDDFYQGITYSGKWQNLASQTFDGSSTIVGGYPFQNSTHTTSNVGDSLSFSYTGTNLSVYGIYPFEQIGSISLSYTIDGGTPSTNNFSSQGAKTINEQPHFKLLETGPLSPGNHTVNMTLASCNGQNLIVDYILYSPSFNSLSTMPDYIPSPSSASEPSSSSSSLSQHHPTPVGAIAGGTIAGVVVLIALLAILFFWCRRHRKPTQKFKIDAEPSPFTDSSPSRPEDIVAETLSPLSEKQSASSLAYTRSIGSVSSPNASSSAYSPSLHTQTQTPHGHLSEFQSIASPRSDTATQNRNVEVLMRRIQDLTEENDRLAMMTSSPPAYE